MNSKVPTALGVTDFHLENISTLTEKSGLHTTTAFSEAVLTLKIWAVIAIVAIGTICNTMSLTAFMMPKLRNTPVGHYLIALALADTVVLVGEAMIWMSDYRLGLLIIHRHVSLCKLTYFLRYTGRLWSAILTAMITVERYVFIAHPLKGALLRTTGIAKGAIISSMVVSQGLSSYTFHTLGITPTARGGRCEITDSEIKIFTLCDLVISRALADVIIGLIVVVFTAMILRSLIIARRRRVEMLPDVIQTWRNLATSRRERQMTLTLILIAVFFLVLKLPYTISWYVRYYSDDNRQMTDAVNITYIFSVATYAINFFLYSLCGSNFRNNLRGYFRLSASRSSSSAVRTCSVKTTT